MHVVIAFVLSSSWLGIYPSFASGFAAIESPLWFTRRPEPPLFTIDAPKITFRICMKRNVRKITTSTDMIILRKLQNRLFEPLPPFPPPPLETSIPTAFGGRRKLPPPLIGAWPVLRCFFRRRSPCSNFGGRLACSELIVE